MRSAHLKTHHGFERLRLRGLSGARDEFHLAAIVQNLKTMALRLLGPATTQNVRVSSVSALHIGEWRTGRCPMDGGSKTESEPHRQKNIPTRRMLIKPPIFQQHRSIRVIFGPAAVSTMG